jgi:uncharacterized membrane protein YtjA (UPF0391 family)
MSGILWTVIAVILAFWVIGLLMDVASGLIHLLLVVAAVLFVVSMFTGRTRV